MRRSPGRGTGCRAREARGATVPPARSIDAHVHVWTPDTVRYPLAAGYGKDRMRPPSFTPEQFFAHARPCGVGRVVLIQMSFYGNDNAYMLDAMARHPAVFSGVARVDQDRQPRQAMQASLPPGGCAGSA